MKKATVILLLLLVSSLLMPGFFPAAAADEPAARTCPAGTAAEQEAGGWPGEPQGHTWLAGAAACPVTPLQSHLQQNLYLGGYGVGPFRGKAKGVRDDIWARALAVSTGRQTVVFLVLDVVGLSCNDISDIRARVERGAGVPKANVLVSSTHTHCAPDMTGLFGGVPRDYRDYFRSQAVSAALEAVRRIQPARLSYAVTQCPDAVKNRREAPHLDPALHVLQAKSRRGKTIATMVTFGVHATWFGADNLLVSADHPGALVAALERDLGGVGIFAAGVEGDQTPDKRGLSMEQYGQKLADAAKAALKSNPVWIRPASIELRSSKFKFTARNFLFVLAGLLNLLPEYQFYFSIADGFYVIAEVNYLRLGDQVGFATAPDEICAHVGLEIKEMGGMDRTVVLGITNGAYGYVVHEDDWKDGIPFITMGYEESASMGRHAAPLIRDRLRALIQAD